MVSFLSGAHKETTFFSCTPFKQNAMPRSPRRWSRKRSKASRKRASPGRRKSARTSPRSYRFRASTEKFDLITIPQNTLLFRSDEAFKRDGADGDERIRLNKPLYLFQEYANAQAYGTVKEYELKRTVHLLSMTEANIRAVIKYLAGVDEITTSKGPMSSDVAIRILLTYLSNEDKVDDIKKNLDSLVWANVKINTVRYPLKHEIEPYESSLAHAVGYILCSFGINGIHHPEGMTRSNGVPFHEEILLCEPRDCVQRRPNDRLPSFTGTITCSSSLGSVRITHVRLTSVRRPYLTFATNPESTFEFMGGDTLGINKSVSTFEIHEQWLIDTWPAGDTPSAGNENDNQTLIDLLSSTQT